QGTARPHHQDREQPRPATPDRGRLVLPPSAGARSPGASAVARPTGGDRRPRQEGPDPPPPALPPARRAGQARAGGRDGGRPRAVWLPLGPDGPGGVARPADLG